MGASIPNDNKMSKVRATEDFLTLDGKVYKLDQTKVTLLKDKEELEKGKDELMETRMIETVKGGKLNKNRGIEEQVQCKLIFKPQYKTKNAPDINLVVFSVSQKPVWGNYQGICEVEGKWIRINLFGFYEHFYARW